uniref:H15 domain-containing protein n=1 Tax=Phocoena sinus TaxID=42100 RepID=A0A8C9C865_PHOSS
MLAPWHVGCPHYLASAPPRGEQRGYCDPHKILVTSQSLLLAAQGGQGSGQSPTRKPLREPGTGTHRLHRGVTQGRLPATILEALQASTSGLPSKRGTGCHASSKTHRKPSISKVILEVMASKGARKRVSLATLRKAVAASGYNMTRSAWRFKRALKGLVDKGMLKQVTGKGATGSTFMANKHASKFKPEAKRRQQQQQRQSGQRRPGQRRLPVGSKQGHKRLAKGVRRAAKCCRS